MTGSIYTLYKVRAKNSDSKRGKSGGYRIIYCLKTDTKYILITLCSKSDQGDLTARELNRLLTDIETNT